MQVSQARPAEDWLLRAEKVLNDVFSSDEYATLLKEAEQFLWAGSEMDRVVAKSLMEAKIWAEAISDCLPKMKFTWSLLMSCLRVEPGHQKLKVSHVAAECHKFALRSVTAVCRYDLTLLARFCFLCWTMLNRKIDSSLSSSPTGYCTLQAPRNNQHVTNVTKSYVVLQLSRMWNSGRVDS
uniref:Uncharacterized protein n=1 Tax=Noccaea caerulescens TaxID=107243 RepID=A0A1J3CQE2_NOCCA